MGPISTKPPAPSPALLSSSPQICMIFRNLTSFLIIYLYIICKKVAFFRGVRICMHLSYSPLFCLSQRKFSVSDNIRSINRCIRLEQANFKPQPPSKRVPSPLPRSHPFLSQICMIFTNLTSFLISYFYLIIYKQSPSWAEGEGGEGEGVQYMYAF